MLVASLREGFEVTWAGATFNTVDIPSYAI